MKRPNRHNRHHRTGLGYMETIAIIAGLALVILAGVSQLGSLVSDDIGQTASGIGDPAQLAHHSRFTGESYIDPDDDSSSDDDNGNNGNGNNGNNSGGKKKGNSESVLNWVVNLFGW